MTTRTTALLNRNTEPVRIVCFGDSITGVYYHTGGRRAYPDMLGIALERIYPTARLTITNSGVSGNTTKEGLDRVERDVLSHRPHLVTIMFGMNDVARIPLRTYETNLRRIVARCRGVGAEVLLCTPTSIYPEDESRPVERLAQFAQTVREVAEEEHVPVADCWRAYEDLRARDPRAWKLLLSETIHPNMNGHKVIAEQITLALTGRRVDLRDVPPPNPAIRTTASRASRGEPLRIVAMEPFDDLILPSLRAGLPSVRAQIISWPVQGRSLAEIEAYARDGVGWMHFQNHPRAVRPHLVLVAVPLGATARSEERFIRCYSQILNWSLSYAAQEWDCMAVLPSVLTPDLNTEERQRESLAREVIRGQDIGLVERPPGDSAPPAELLARWISLQALSGTPPGPTPGPPAG